MAGRLFSRAADSVGRLGDDQALSRWHARLDFADGVLTIEDLGSRNGTHVNGRRISGRQPVRPGDVVVLGTSQLQALAAPTTAPAQPRTLTATTVLPPPAPATPTPAAPAQPNVEPQSGHDLPADPTADPATPWRLDPDSGRLATKEEPVGLRSSRQLPPVDGA